jgi:putative radical SAM enzyme (TIGR03279 family)
MSGLIKSIEPGSVAAAAGLVAGDEVRAINGHALFDVIDAQFYGADDELTIAFARGGAAREVYVQREFGQALGIEFEHPTFDIDIRRCNNLCPFCFVLQNAPKMRRTLYIKDDDYRYSFLFGHYVTLTNLSERDWAKIAEQRLTPLYVSVHATNLDVRRKCLRNPNAPEILGQLKWLAERGIQVHTQLVLTPGLNDGEHLVRSVHELAALHPNVLSATVVPVGLTKHHKYGHRAHTPAEAAAVVNTVQGWQKQFQSALGVRFVYLTDEWYLISQKTLPRASTYDGYQLQSNGMGMVRDFLDEWSRVKRTELGRQETGVGRRKVMRRSAVNSKPLTFNRQVQTLQPIYKSATLATGALFGPTLKRVVAEFNNLVHPTQLRLDVTTIVNEHLGDSITVAGLLPGQDVINQLKATPSPLGDIVILPRLMFDHPDSIALDDVSPLQVAQALKRPVALADWMGDVVDALAGNNKLTFYPDANSLNVPVVREGGWAVEKYL